MVRSFNLKDLQEFTLLTGDTNHLHTQSDLVSTPIVPGILLASLFPAIIGSKFPGALYAKQELVFKASVLVRVYLLSTQS